MIKKRISIFLMFILPGCGWLISCSSDTHPFKILYINSYHEGYPSSDDITAGIKNTVQQPGVVLKIFYLDSKQNQEEVFIRRKTAEILKEMDSYNPDVLIVSDDNAVKYLVVPYLMNREIPIIFCGVNWTAAPYGLPNEHITGMLEVLPVEEGMKLIRKMDPSISRVAILSENSVSELKNIEFITTILKNAGLVVTYRLANTFDEWKSFFKLANENSDVIYMPTNGAIKGWQKEEAINFIRETMQVPLLTCDDFMMPYAILGVTKVQQEQGIWAGEAALKIRGGIKLSMIGLTHNSAVKIWWNAELAKQIHLIPDDTLLTEINQFEY